MNNLERYLQSVEKHEERKTDKIVVERNSNVDEIVKTYENWSESWLYYFSNNFLNKYGYPTIMDFVKAINYDSSDVRDFSVKLKDYEDQKFFRYTGLFLSALINNSKEREFDLLTDHLRVKIDYIGLCNIKKINVRGGTGDFTGSSMEEGMINITGNSGSFTGYMIKGGIINVQGKIKPVLVNVYGGKIYQKGILVGGA